MLPSTVARLIGAVLASALACVTVWREGGCCATFDGGGSTVSVLADVTCAGSYAGARHGVARRWLLCYLRLRRLYVLADVSCAGSYAGARHLVGREGGCCATFDGGGSTVSVLADASSATGGFISAACAGFYAGMRHSWCGAKVVAALPSTAAALPSLCAR